MCFGNSPVPKSEKSHLFKNLFIFLCSLQIASPFHDQHCTLSKILKVIISLRNAHLCSERRSFLLIRTAQMVSSG